MTRIDFLPLESFLGLLPCEPLPEFRQRYGGVKRKAANQEWTR